MTTLDLLVARGAHRPGDDVVLLVDSGASAEVTCLVTHLGEPVDHRTVSVAAGRSEISLGRYAPGSYAVRLSTTDGRSVTTAFDVLADPVRRLRYGFVADFAAGRDDHTDLIDSLRAFHVTAVQFYDWMYRHAELLPPVAEFEDALGRRLSLHTVRALVEAVHDAGALALGYAAVYGAGDEYADAHPDQVLRHRDGTPWRLADFLRIMDVSAGSPWSRHIVDQMRAAVEAVGFDGLHLDQYGDPKLAATASGDVVDLAAAFVAVIRAVREALPDATLIFNNVNDFPTSGTVHAPQDVTYIEVWPPHDDYADLVRLVDAARDLAPDRSVTLAAYLEPFAGSDREGALTAATLALSVVWASRGQYLLFGERHGVLTDPYYPRYATLPAESVSVLRRFADFAVANGDLMTDPSFARATRVLWRGVNDDVSVEGGPASADPVAGSVWVRLSRNGSRLVVQLVDLRDQDDARWNVSKRPTKLIEGLTVRVRAVSPTVRAWFGDPWSGPELREVDAMDDGEYVEITLPPFRTWGLLLVDS